MASCDTRSGPDYDSRVRALEDLRTSALIEATRLPDGPRRQRALGRAEAFELAATMVAGKHMSLPDLMQQERKG